MVQNFTVFVSIYLFVITRIPNFELILLGLANTAFCLTVIQTIILKLEQGTGTRRQFTFAVCYYRCMSNIGSKVSKELLIVDGIASEDTIIALEEGVDYWFTNKENIKDTIEERLVKESGVLIEDYNFFVTNDAAVGQLVNAVRVRMINTCHCPGSCMFVFFIYQFQNGQFGDPYVYAYTGDYYYTREMEDKLIAILDGHTNGVIYYDDMRTCSNDICLSMEEAQEQICNYIRQYCTKNEEDKKGKPVFLFLSDRIGKEEIWLGVARKLKKEKVFVERERYDRLLCYIKDDDMLNLIQYDNPKDAL